jgi:hypothetical protein
MHPTLLGAAALLVLATPPAAADVPVTLRGSPESMARQHRVARDHGLTFTRTPAQIRELKGRGELVLVEPSDDVALLPTISNPVAHPVTRAFIERTAAAYRDACGERLVVTSLTRPTSRQPANSHPLSVHPTGIAVDLRISQRADCRGWLERTLLAMEAEGLLDITREQRPPHYHVALFPEPYLEFLERTEGPPLREPPPLEVLLSVPNMAMSFLPAVAAAAPQATATVRPSRMAQRWSAGQWALALAVPLALAGVPALARRRRERA